MFELSIVLLVFFFMEFVAWFTHKYIMHGFLWFLHYDHHNTTGKFFQKNDAFFLIFAIPSSILMILGFTDGGDIKLWIGTGILFYGIAYFLVHEVLIHQRFKKLRKFLFGKAKHPYLRGLLKAHYAHHAKLEKEGGVSFGMLIVFPKYFR